MKPASLMVIAGLALMACTPADESATSASTDTAAPAATTPDQPPGAEPAPPSPAVDAGDTCNMAQYASLVGKPATDPETPPAGPTVRHIGPDTQVTMDFQPTRLNLEINAEGMITGVRCG